MLDTVCIEDLVRAVPVWLHLAHILFSVDSVVVAVVGCIV